MGTTLWLWDDGINQPVLEIVFRGEVQGTRRNRVGFLVGFLYMGWVCPVSAFFAILQGNLSGPFRLWSRP